MNIPFDIKIFSWIYESGKYLLPLLLVLWLTWLCCVIILRKKKQFLFTSVMFLLFCVINAFFTWCGWHYRMELRERYALVQAGKSGWLDTQTGKVYNMFINCGLMAVRPQTNEEDIQNGKNPEAGR